MQTNKEIRCSIGANGVKYWQVAEALGISESAFSRKLRKELPDDEKKTILAVIEELGKEN